MLSQTPIASIAVVEDDATFRDEICFFLNQNGFKTYPVVHGKALEDLLLFERIDIVLLDINLPGMSGFEISKKIRQTDNRISIIILSHRSAVRDRLFGYDVGTDFYLDKTTSPAEILAVLNSVASRLRLVYEVSAMWCFNMAEKTLKDTVGNVVRLTDAEIKILVATSQSINRTVSSDLLCSVVSQDSDQPISVRALENIVSRFRLKVRRVHGNRDLNPLQFSPRVGYRLAITLVFTSG